MIHCSGVVFMQLGRHGKTAPLSAKSFRSFLWQKRCISYTIISSSAFFLLSLLLLLIMIPIQQQIGGVALSFSARRGTENGESLALLTEINGLWYSSVMTALSLNPGETLTVWLADIVRTTWLNHSRSQEIIPTSQILYALAGSEITYILYYNDTSSSDVNSIEGNLTVTLLEPGGTVCQNSSTGSSVEMISLTCPLLETGYYSVQINLSPQTMISEYIHKSLQYDRQYYQQSEFYSCTFSSPSSGNDCQGLPVDEIDTHYQLIGSFNLSPSLAGVNSSVQVSTSLNERQAWYCVVVFPLILSSVCVCIVLIALCLTSRQYKHQLKHSHV